MNLRRSVQPKYYRDERGEWRWKITARNGKRTHSATEGFTSKQGAERNFDLLLDVGLAMSPAVQSDDAPIME